MNDVPSERIIEIDDYLIDFNVIGSGTHESLQVIRRFWDSLLGHYFLIKLVNCQPLNEVDGKGEGKVVFDLAMRDLLLGQGANL